MSEKDTTPPAAVPFREFQTAFENYFSDLNAACNDARRRLQEIQLEYARNLQTQVQSQGAKDVLTAQKDFQSVQDKFTRDIQSASMDTSAFNRFSEAYDKYRKSVQGALNNAELDPTTMAILGQHMLMVAQTACCMPPATTASASNPFSSSTGGSAPANPFR